MSIPARKVYKRRALNLPFYPSLSRKPHAFNSLLARQADFNKGKMLLAVLALAFACGNHAEVQSRQPLKIGIRFHLENPKLVQQVKLALSYYANLIDLIWYPEDSQDCVLNLVDEPLGDTVIAVARASGTIAFSTQFHLSSREQFVVAVHELGHEFGLPHSDSIRSVMIDSTEDLYGPGLLDNDDLRILFSKHKRH